MTLPKYLGRDCELSTTGSDERGRAISPWDVTQAVLEHVDAAFEPEGARSWTRPTAWDSGRGGTGWPYATTGGGWGGSAYSSDALRRWTPGGQCYYADMSHVEVCTAEVLTPRGFAAQSLSTLLVAEAARGCAQALAPDGTRYSLSTANVDMANAAIAWGTHLNVAVERELWEDLFAPHRPPVLASVSSAVAATVVFFGTGLILPLGDGSVQYSLSSRAHHLNELITLSTTEAFRRGVLNSRREPHGAGHERMHLIGYDFTLIGAALLASVLQCALAAAEEHALGPMLYDPVHALQGWSLGFDPARGRLTHGERAVGVKGLVTLPAFVRMLVEPLFEMVQTGLIGPDVAPEASEHLALVLELADAAERGELGRLARHLDWAAKWAWLTSLGERRRASLADPALAVADHDFANTDPERGVLWRLLHAGAVDPLVSLDDARACLRDGPDESRAFGRGRLVRKFAGRITGIDWSWVELARGDDRWAPRLRLSMPALDSLSRARFEAVVDAAESVDELEALLARELEGVGETDDPLRDVPSRLAAPYDDESSAGVSSDPEPPISSEN